MYLNVHSQFSLRYGTLSLNDIVETAKNLGIKTLALTDINNSSGCMEFIRLCRKNAIKPIVGIEFRRKNRLLYIGIAKNKEGMRELNYFLSKHNFTKQELPDRPEHDFKNVYLIYPYPHKNFTLKTYEYIGVKPSQTQHLFRKKIVHIKHKLLAINTVTIANESKSYRFHEYLRAIDLNTLLSKVQTEDKCHRNEYFKSEEECQAIFSQYEYMISNTENLLNNCHTDDYIFGNLNRKTFTGSKKDDKALLEKLTWEGLWYRYGKNNQVAIKKIKHELQVIDDLNFCAYFLITWDIIRYAMARGYYHVGRGSGANSTVAYCLQITDVDPIELDLYFERFLNPKRTSPPDFDIDFSWDEREEVQDYIFKRYGAEYTALLGTMSTFKDRSVIREIGKVLGLPKTEIDSFTDPSNDQKNRDNTTFKKIMALLDLMQNTPNQRSVHAGGILISEESIYYYTALDFPPKGMPTVQWDMYEAEAIGYDKYDILSQRGIGHIKEAARLVLENKKIKLDVHDVKAFMKDVQVNKQLKTGNTIGCFYIESPAMRQLIKKLSCENYLTLVAASSIIRPGVANSGMMKNYIHYYHHPNEVKYLHPVMEEQLKETFGVMVYQEDVIKVCFHYAGLDLADADVLRRGMSGKYRSKTEFDKLVQKFFDCAKEIGRDEDTTKEIWRQVSSFAGYSFSKAHSASFAVESYQSLFLKTYYPLEFMVAVLNNYGGFYKRWVYVHELIKAGAQVHLPCVNHSDAKVNICGTTVYLGLIGIQGLENKFIERIPDERETNGCYKNLEDFIKRTSISLEQCTLLIRIGALRFTGMEKKELLWDVHNYLRQNRKNTAHTELFNAAVKTFKMPKFKDDTLESAYQELELLGYPITISMFDLLKTDYKGEVSAKNLSQCIGKRVRMVGNFVCEKQIRTKHDKKMWFATFLDAEGHFFDTTHFPNNTPTYPFTGKGCYLILGKVVEDFGFPSLEVIKFAKLPIKDNPIMA